MRISIHIQKKRTVFFLSIIINNNKSLASSQCTSYITLIGRGNGEVLYKVRCIGKADREWVRRRLRWRIYIENKHIYIYIYYIYILYITAHAGTVGSRRRRRKEEIPISLLGPEYKYRKYVRLDTLKSNY